MARNTYNGVWRPEPAAGLDYKPTEEHRNRIWWVSFAFLIGCGVIALRLMQLHLTPGHKLSEEDALHIGSIMLEEPRGEIFDRNGLVIATNRLVPSLYVDPRRVSDSLNLANYLSVHLDLSEDELLTCFNRFDAQGNTRKMNTVKRWLTDHSEDQLDAMLIKSGGALNIHREPVRYYPHGDSASHLLGFVNRVGNASEGLELAFDKHLRSEAGEVSARKDRDRRLLPSGILQYRKPEGGEMVQLTLDINMQHTLEAALDRRMEEVGAKAAMGMLMDPHTGAIFALASRPAFDPNAYNAYAPELRKNRALLDVFEPGSVFKIVTASAALEHGLVTVDTMIDCENGGFNPYGHRIRDFYKLGVIPFSRAFEKSSNVAVIKLAALLGPERLEEWIRLFGFGEQTSPDFQFESRGLFRGRDKWSRLSMGSLPMGQEIAVTIPQLAKAMAVIANGGSVVQPYFVERAVTRRGEVTYQYDPPLTVRILSPETAKIMQQLCHQAVLHGTGSAANILEYRSGGKTGTAQMARTNGRGYDPDRYTTVFAGFAPVADPRIVAVIVVQEPSIRERWGGFVCGPVFKEVVRDALIRMNVPEDPVIDPDAPVPPTQLAKKAAPTAGKIPSDVVDRFELDPDTVVTPPPAPEDLDERLEALLMPLDGLDLVARRVAAGRADMTMPDLMGLTKVEAREILQRLGAVMDIQGAGWVIAQKPTPGTPLDDKVLCALRFGDKTAELSDNDAL